jgi:Tfp pilus assembly protein PilV
MLKSHSAHADPTAMGRRRMTDASGFTLVELMIAAMVLVVGMLATVSLITQGLKKTTLNGQRVAATNLARELTEAARVAGYPKLTPTTLVAALQAASSQLGSGSSPWTIQRRNTTYTVTASVCTYDDPADKLAASAPDNRCTLAAGTDTTTGDNNGDDFRRVTFGLTWQLQGKTYSLTQNALVVNPSGGLGPRIMTPFPSAPYTSPLAKITTETTVPFTFLTSSAATVHWNVDDGVSGGFATGGATSWSINWDLKNINATGSVLDGTYSISVQPFDDRNIAGDTKVVSVTINRSAPLAPTGFSGGHDTRAGDWVDFEWGLNAERDIVGYRVYSMGPDNAVGGGDDSRVCPAPAAPTTYLPNTATTCQDTAPPSGGQRYYLVALDYDNATPAVLREGAKSTLSVGSASSTPNAPGTPSLGSFGPPTLSWTAPTSGSAPAFYRVYRDGIAVTNRIGKLTGLVYVDNGGDDGDPHTYWVTAVDSSYNESPLVGPALWNGGP